MIRAVAAVAALLCSSAHAAAVYEWQQVSGSPTMPQTFGQLVVTDAAFAAGRASVTFSNAGLGRALSLPAEPILRFDFGIRGVPSAVGFSAGDAQEFGRYSELDFGITLGQTVSGRIGVLDNNEHSVRMSSVGDLFTVGSFNTDNGGLVGFSNCTLLETNCSGATGRFVLTSAGGRVPLPGTLPLMALGVFGLAAALRQRKA